LFSFFKSSRGLFFCFALPFEVKQKRRNKKKDKDEDGGEAAVKAKQKDGGEAAVKGEAKSKKIKDKSCIK